MPSSGFSLTILVVAILAGGETRDSLIPICKPPAPMCSMFKTSVCEWSETGEPRWTCRGYFETANDQPRPNITKTAAEAQQAPQPDVALGTDEFKIPHNESKDDSQSFNGTSTHPITPEVKKTPGVQEPNGMLSTPSLTNGNSPTEQLQAPEATIGTYTPATAGKMLSPETTEEESINIVPVPTTEKGSNVDTGILNLLLPSVHQKTPRVTNSNDENNDTSVTRLPTTENSLISKLPSISSAEIGRDTQPGLSRKTDEFEHAGSDDNQLGNLQNPLDQNSNGSIESKTGSNDGIQPAPGSRMEEKEHHKLQATVTGNDTGTKLDVGAEVVNSVEGAKILNDPSKVQVTNSNDAPKYDRVSTNLGVQQSATDSYSQGDIKPAGEIQQGYASGYAVCIGYPHYGCQYSLPYGCGGTIANAGSYINLNPQYDTAVPGLTGDFREPATAYGFTGENPGYSHVNMFPTLSGERIVRGRNEYTGTGIDISHAGLIQSPTIIKLVPYQNIVVASTSEPRYLTTPTPRGGIQHYLVSAVDDGLMSGYRYGGNGGYQSVEQYVLPSFSQSAGLRPWRNLGGTLWNLLNGVMGVYDLNWLLGHGTPIIIPLHSSMGAVQQRMLPSTNPEYIDIYPIDQGSILNVPPQNSFYH